MMKKIITGKISTESMVLAITVLTILVFVVIMNFFLSSHEYTELAKSFAKGKTYFISPVDQNDTVVIDGRQYWPLPPLPAVILVPVTLLIGYADQRGVSLLLNIFNFILIYLLAWKKFNFTKINSLWLSLMYVFASVYAIAAYVSTPYNYAHALATSLLFAAIWEWKGQRRYWLIGICMGLTLMTRYTAVLSGFFFFLMIIEEENKFKPALKKILQLSAPVVAAGMLLMAYNYIRFASLTDVGYASVFHPENIQVIKKSGLFNIAYFPVNFYNYFCNFINPKYLSFFAVSPLFLWLVFTDFKNPVARNALLGAAAVITPLLFYYYSGWPQIGPRYMNDALPFLFLALMLVFQKINLRYWHKAIILTSAIANIIIFYRI